MTEKKNPYNYHKPTDYQLEAMTALRQACRDHQAVIDKWLSVPGRYRSLAITTLEELSFWENKSCVFELPEENPNTHD